LPRRSAERKRCNNKDLHEKPFQARDDWGQLIRTGGANGGKSWEIRAFGGAAGILSPVSRRFSAGLRVKTTA